MANVVESLIRQNIMAIFGERDAAKRRDVMGRLWSSDGIFIDPSGAHVGHGAIDAAAAALQQRFPGFVFTERSAVDSHNTVGRLAWGFGPPGGVPALTGIDVAVVVQGKLSAVYVFVDAVKS